MPKTNFKNQPKTCSRGASALGGDAPRARTPSPKPLQKRKGFFGAFAAVLSLGIVAVVIFFQFAPERMS